jgi:tyrosine-protein kinase Etk/Wzc
MDNRELFPLKNEQPKAKDLRTILSHYIRYWYLFILGAMVALGIAYIYLRYYVVPAYQVTSTLLIKSESNKPTLSGGEMGSVSMGGGATDLNNEIEVLKSKSLMQRVVAELSYFTTYYIKGQVRDIEVYGKSSPITIVVGKLTPAAYGRTLTIRLKADNKFDLQEGDNKPSSQQLGQLIHQPYGTFTVVATPYAATDNKLFSKDIIVRFQNQQDVVNYLHSSVKIAPVSKDATILEVSLTDAIPERGKDIINKLIEIYNKEGLEYKNRNATNTINFLDDRLRFITSELSGVEKNVEQYKRQNQVTDVSSQASNYIEQASSYNKQLSEWAIQIDVLESIEKYLNKSAGQYTMVPSSLGIQDPTLQSLIEKFNGLQLERERMLRTMEVSNPVIENIDEQLANLRSNILENLQNIKQGLIITSRNLKASSGQFQSQIKKVPSIERELLEINRQQAIKQMLYSFLLQRREEAGLELASTVSNSRVVDVAVSSDYPVSPVKQLIYLMALLAGLAVPFAGIYIKELLNDKIQSAEDVEYTTNTPILGEVGMSSVRDKIVVTKDNRAPVAEMFRLIRANLSFMMRNKSNKVILVTSSMSGEGKTFFSINFASSLVLTGKKVILLELDLRNSDLSHVLDISPGLGITDYLNSDDVYITDIISESEKIPGLHVISSGPVPINPSELMMSAKLAHLLTELKTSFDYIILDTAPIGKVADVFSLSALIDSSIYLVRCNYTYKRMINIANDIYVNNKLNNLMIVLNDVKMESSHSYGYGYEQKDKKKLKLA